jgi:hypothetical protein
MNFHQKLEGKAVKALLVGADIRRRFCAMSSVIPFKKIQTSPTDGADVAQVDTG